MHLQGKHALVTGGGTGILGMWKAFDEEPLDLDRTDKKIFIRMINNEFNDIYDKHVDQKRNPENGAK